MQASSGISSNGHHVSVDSLIRMLSNIKIGNENLIGVDIFNGGGHRNSILFPPEITDNHASIDSLNDTLTEMSIGDDKHPIEVEISNHDGRRESIIFSPEMWINMRQIMRNRIARIFQAAGDRVDELNSFMSLFSNDWFTGVHPITRYSLNWDFNTENIGSMTRSIDADTSEGESSDEIQSTTDASFGFTSDENFDDSDDSWGKPISPSTMQRNLYALYHQN